MDTFITIMVQVGMLLQFDTVRELIISMLDTTDMTIDKDHLKQTPSATSSQTEHRYLT